MTEAIHIIQADFDRIALLSDDVWNPNSHYHDFLLRQLPADCRTALEIGCGTGAFSRLLAKRSERVLALDLSPQMIRIAAERSAQFSNLEFRVVDVNAWEFPAGQFDCIATIATLHHLPMTDMLNRMKVALATGGVMLVLDLYQAKGWLDMLLSALALPVNVGLRLIRQRRLRAPREVREAWAEHGRHDVYPTFAQVRQVCAELLPGAKIRKHLLWRYSIRWEKPSSVTTEFTR
jgi:ubiquinone/menaquinone biosynthesis C-methylase UbiE